MNHSNLSCFSPRSCGVGIYPQIANTIALTGTGIEGSYKRSVVIGMVTSMGNINVSVCIHRRTDSLGILWLSSPSPSLFPSLPTLLSSRVPVPPRSTVHKTRHGSVSVMDSSSSTSLSDSSLPWPSGGEFVVRTWRETEVNATRPS